MTDTNENAVCKEFMNAHTKAVFATVDGEGNPHTSLMLFVADDDWNIYFGTKKSSKKYEGLKAHPNIAVTIVDATPDPLRTADVTGTVEELSDEERATWFAYFKEKNKSAYYVENADDFTMFRIKPSSIKFSDATGGKLIATDII